MIADLFPPKIRKAIYSVLGSVNAFIAIPGVIPAGVAAKIVAGIGALGFTLAVKNVRTKWFEQ